MFYLLLGICLVNNLVAQIGPISNFQVASSGLSPVVAASPNGEFMVVWRKGQASAVNPLPFFPPLHLYGRVFEADGTPKGPEFEVYTGAALSGHVTLKADDLGNYTCFWSITPTRSGPGGSIPTIFMQRFDSKGRARTPGESVITTGKNRDAEIIYHHFDADTASDGSFVIVWSESLQLYDAQSIIYAQRFDSRANPIGSEFVVTPGDPEPYQSQTMVRVALDEEGEIAIAWLHRYFPEFPSAETSIQLKVAIFDNNGVLLDSYVVLEHEVIKGHEHHAPKIDKVAGIGFVVMTNHTTKRDIDEGETITKEVSSTFEGRFYPDQGEPTDLKIFPVFKVIGTTLFDIALTAQGKIAVVFDGEKPDQKYPHFVEFNQDFSISSDYKILNESGTISDNREVGPTITPLPNGNYIYSFTKLPEGFPENQYYEVRAGVIQMNNAGAISPLTPTFQLLNNDQFEVQFETLPGRNYRIRRGADPRNLIDEEVILGEGNSITRQYSIGLKQEIFSISEE
ncbi:hypothetical protein OAM01_01480 [bacterium]|nr:hypothetical protein [bacterium]